MLLKTILRLTFTISLSHSKAKLEQLELYFYSLSLKTKDSLTILSFYLSSAVSNTLATCGQWASTLWLIKVFYNLKIAIFK